MTAADLLLLVLAVVNMAGMAFSICERHRQRQRWLLLVKERAALEVFLRDEFQCEVRFRHDGEMLHLDAYQVDRAHHAQTPFTFTVN